MCSECQCLRVSQLDNSRRVNNAYEKLGVILTVVGDTEQMVGCFMRISIETTEKNSNYSIEEGGTKEV